jgi:hypothetical protein
MFNFRPYFPWLRFHTGPAEDDPPGFHFNPEATPGAQPHTFSLATPADMSDANSRIATDEDFGGAVGPRVGVGDPLDPFNGQGAASTSPDGGLHTPNFPSPPFPSMAEPSSFGLGLHDFGGQVQRDTSVPGFRVQPPDDPPGLRAWPPGFRMATGDVDPNALPEERGLRSFGYTPGGFAVGEAMPRGNSQVYSVTPPLYDPVYFPEPPPDRIKQALDEIARIYGLRRFRPTSLVNRPTTSIGSKLANGETGDDKSSTATDVFDPRYILPVQGGGGGARPPLPIRTPPIQSPQGQPSPATRGIGDNKGPPLGPPPSSSTSSPPAASSPAQGAPPLRAPTRVEPQPSPAGPAAAAEQRSKTSPQPHPNPRVEAVWDRIAKVLNEDAPDPKHDKSSGRATGVGVFVDRRLPKPAAGWKYNPPPGHLRSGYIGELKLANRIVTALKDEVVVHYGMPAGMRGPDVISVAPDGTISVWDSKWRTGPRLISRGGHQSDSSLDHVWKKVRAEIELAAESGRLPPDIGAKALENAANGNFLVITVGTGNAHGGVVRSVQGGKYAASGSN